MDNPDYAHVLTDDIIDDIAFEIAKVYAQALNEMTEKQKEFLKDYEAELKEMENLLKLGTIDKKYYRKWLKTKARDKAWYAAMVDSLAKDLVNADKIAAGIVWENLPEIFAINHDWGTFEIEQIAGVDTSYTLYNLDTVANLIMAEPDLVPMVSVDEVKDYNYFSQKLSHAMTQGILQGESIPKIAKRVGQISDIGFNSAVRTARTAATSAQNAGREKSYQRARELGIDVKKQWFAILDSRTRKSHRNVDKEIRELDETFSNGLMRPGDPSGSPSEVWNCRCTEVAYIPGVSDDNLTRSNKLYGLSYEEWKKGKNPASPDNGEKKKKPAKTKEKTTKKKNDVAKKEDKKPIAKKKLTRKDLQSMGRPELVAIARDIYLKNSGLSTQEAMYRFESLITSNTKTHLIKYIMNHQ